MRFRKTASGAPSIAAMPICSGGDTFLGSVKPQSGRACRPGLIQATGTKKKRKLGTKKQESTNAAVGFIQEKESSTTPQKKQRRFASSMSEPE